MPQLSTRVWTLCFGQAYREECERFISDLEGELTKHKYLMGEYPSLADYAILPFIRQFSRVERKWYLTAS
ncbi:glutathione binding-like protein [Photobacterium rosenbergii]|uniref:Glutathione binding-like protein n=1 Tax=Photobacterium rosenbergii TaxID=294936 RepID=A0ABU3ZEW3_9GAMM|nr:glutathione binding-like protein [Photobacterium rosenbergii]MDV5168650.1 glutathione binding-like protein [Photobacterium rosenbergii]